MQGLNQSVCGSSKGVGKKNLKTDGGAMKVKDNRKLIRWRQRRSSEPHF